MRRAAGLLLVVALVAAVCAVTFAQRGGGFYFREGEPGGALRSGAHAGRLVRHLPTRLYARALGSERHRLADRLPLRRDQPDDPVSELTKTRVSRDGDGTPNYYVVRTTDDALFNCPVVFISDAGTLGIEGREIDRLRQYLTKGGFIWADDFWGEAAMGALVGADPAGAATADYIIEDVPLNDPMLHSMIPMVKIPQNHEHPVLARRMAARSRRSVRTATKCTCA
jgi:hypothetical protein